MDAEAVAREIAESMLNHLVFRVTTCDHGKEAIEFYRKACETEKILQQYCATSSYRLALVVSNHCISSLLKVFSFGLWFSTTQRRDMF